MIGRRALLALVALSIVSCVGTTGSDLVTFGAYAAGPEDAAEGAPYSFSTERGYAVTLTKAKLHVGAVYLNRSVPQVGVAETSCVLPGIYVAQITSGTTVDVLSPKLQQLPAWGEGTADLALAAEVWLNGGAIDADEDPTVILEVAGTAAGPEGAYPFEAALTIGDNRRVPPDNPALPGASPLCKQRIVTPIAVRIRPEDGGSLVVRVNPRAWFDNVDFSRMPEPIGGVYRFLDESNGQPSINLYKGMRSVAAFDVRWQPPP